ncbi:protein kinase domain-containing protein [Scytonema sp. PCC 10023]|uniref:protein kinase domain-containing protein n=1 Tax=Scytonema sp. PCC 10023 TaxID=1680591 RepID=UPI0039C74791
MLYCLNPKCSQRQNSDAATKCEACNTPLLIKNRYLPIRPLCNLDAPYRYSEIFEVKDIKDNNTLKVLKVLMKNDSKIVELFEQEANILSQLTHPGIPKAEEKFSLYFNNGQELLCLIMEKFKGQNLQQWLNENDNEPISQDLAIYWLKQITEILAYVHQNGFLHRDIKPSNIILKPNGKLALIDFGTAREITQTVINGHTVTFVCSYGYTAPEQFQRKVVPQSDFFALGRTFVHLLTGQHPSNLACSSVTGHLIWPSLASDISPIFANFIDRLMEPSLGKRPKNTQEILREREQVILQIAWQRLKEIDPVIQISSLEKKPAHSNSKGIVMANVEPTPNLVLSPEKYSVLENKLIELLGPIAPTLLHQAGKDTLNPKELVENLRLYLSKQEQVEFEKQVMLLMQDTAGKLHTTSTERQSKEKQKINENFVRQCEKELADIVGPVATFLVQKVLESYPEISPARLVQMLGQEIPEEENAYKFQQRLSNINS